VIIESTVEGLPGDGRPPLIKEPQDADEDQREQSHGGRVAEGDAVAVELRIEEGECPGSPLALPVNGYPGEGRL
jgi:hypothetical protein